MSGQVQSRHVFYLSGFDPRGAGHYYRLYLDEAVKQSKVSGVELEISKRHRLNSQQHAWDIVSCDNSGNRTETTMEFLGWDDIIRKYWSTGLGAILGDFLLFSRCYLFNGHAHKVFTVSPMQSIVLFYPLIYILLFLSLGLWGTTELFRQLLQIGSLAQPLALFLGLLISLPLLWVTQKIALSLGKRLAVFWLLRIYTFAVRWGKGDVDGLDARIDLFADRLVEVVAEGAHEEVVVVGHSVGTMLAVSVVARAIEKLEQRQLPLASDRLVLVTLGECIPLLGLWPSATGFRDDLQRLGSTPELLWVDYTAPTDGACCPLLDPVRACGLEPVTGAGPLILSPRFFKLFSESTYKIIRRQWYTMHFLYLMATELPGEYDYFAITAGTRCMATRHKRSS